MKHLLWMVLATAICTLSSPIRAESTATPQKLPSQGIEAAKAIATITGVAISPLLGTSVVGAYQYFKGPNGKKDKLPWYAHPYFWLPALLLTGAVAAKDSFGTVIPPGLKKPLDALEVVENKFSGLVAVFAFVPAIASIFGSHNGSSAFLGHGLSAAGFATINFSALLNIFTIPLAMVAFVLVWLVGHVINVLILISPFGVVDAALKSIRTSLMGLVTVTSFANPVAGAVLSLIIIVIAYFLAGWSFRLTVFGSVYVWDFFTGRSRRFKPAPNANWMFLSHKIDKTPIRTYGKLVRGEQGQLSFEYRPWLVMKSETLALPQSNYAVGRGLFYPEIMQPDKESGKMKSLFSMPPRYHKHEEEVARIYGITDVRDIGLLKGFKAIWNWLEGLFGFGAKHTPTPAPA